MASVLGFDAVSAGFQPGYRLDDGFPQRLRMARGPWVVRGGDDFRDGIKDRNTWARYEKGETFPDARVLDLLKRRGIDANWLLTGEGVMTVTTAPSPAGAVPVLGLAQCGLDGWFQSADTGLFVAAPPSVALDDKAVAVMATGDSMRPAGIRPGDLVFCADRPLALGDSALVVLADDKLALKRWHGVTDGWVTLTGWLDAADGPQLPFTDRRRADQVKRVLRVQLVRPGLDGTLGASQAAGLDRLYEVTISALLRWYQSRDDMALPESQAVAAMVVKLVAQIRDGAQTKTDAELALQVTQLLDITRELLATGGWKPK